MAIVLVDVIEADRALWRVALAAELPDLDVVFWPDAGDAASVTYIVARQLKGADVARFPNVRFVALIPAGADVLLADGQLPRAVPVLRTASPDGDPTMTEYVLTHVLMHHREVLQYAAQQRDAVWKARRIVAASERYVGVLGYGNLARPAVAALRQIGFRVGVWSSRPRSEAGIDHYSGRDGLEALLRRTEILVNLLPLTPETEGILNRDHLSQLPCGARLINVARGRHLVEEDLIALLRAGHLASATLDVFHEEPLPADNPLWREPHVLITPHNSRRPAQGWAIPAVVSHIRRDRLGLAPEMAIDVSRGY